MITRKIKIGEFFYYFSCSIPFRTLRTIHNHFLRRPLLRRGGRVENRLDENWAHVHYIYIYANMYLSIYIYIYAITLSKSRQFIDIFFMKFTLFLRYCFISNIKPVQCIRLKIFSEERVYFISKIKLIQSIRLKIFQEERVS